MNSPSKSTYPALLSLPRLATLLGSLLVGICSGSGYAFSAYAPQLGTRLQINHTQLNILAMAGSAGIYATSFICGRIVDKRGPRMLLAAGALFLFLGYSGLRLIFDGGLQPGKTTISTFRFYLLVLCEFFTGVGAVCGIMSSVNATAKTFPDSARGLTTGIVASGFGLSAFIFSTAARVAFPGDTSSFLKLLTYGTALPIIICVFLVRPIPLPPADADLENERVSALEHGAILVGTDSDMGEGERGEEARLLDRPEDDPGHSLPVATLRDDRPNFYGKALFMNGQFWELFFILSLLTGTGLMYIGNIGSISQVLYLASTLNNNNGTYDPVEAARWQATQVSAFSITNFAGRLIMGLISDLLKRTLSLPRSANLSLVSFLFLSSQIATASISNIANLQIASLMLGFAYGSVYSLGPTVCLEWFGMPHFSENWGYLIMSPMIGGNLLSLAFGMNLDRHSTPSSGPSPSVLSTVDGIPGGGTNTTLTLAAATSVMREGRCELGRLCYVDTLYLSIGGCAVALGLSAWAGYRDWRKITMGEKRLV